VRYQEVVHAQAIWKRAPAGHLRAWWPGNGVSSESGDVTPGSNWSLPRAMGCRPSEWSTPWPCSALMSPTPVRTSPTSMVPRRRVSSALAMPSTTLMLAKRLQMDRPSAARRRSTPGSPARQARPLWLPSMKTGGCRREVGTQDHEPHLLSQLDHHRFVAALPTPRPASLRASRPPDLCHRSGRSQIQTLCRIGSEEATMGRRCRPEGSARRCAGPTL
jgi:hypothetical protein